MTLRGWLSLLVCGFISWGCNPSDPLFRVRNSSETGILFANRLTESDSLNALTYEYMYNGAGVGAGDFNNDGLIDLYFAGNQVSSRLYMNTGALRFTDITGSSGTGTDVWCTGVSVADVNQDGWMDIYVCVAGPTKDSTRRANRLFINNGPTPDNRPTFTERAKEYGLADTGYSTQAAFFDYDRDGDLDCYVLTNALESVNRNTLRPKRLNGEAPSTDRLYRNTAREQKTKNEVPHARFVDVSREEGILIEGYGLGLCVSDFNDDGWPDVYCANDFLSNDLVWINRRGQAPNGAAFENRAASMLKHQTHNGMGVDVADVNNDARPDIMVLDMLPEDNYRQKMMLPGSNYNRFQMDLQQGYEPQYMRNTLQLNQGCKQNGDVCFSEIGQLAGVSKTDWSWAPLLADYDNDGRKDLYVTNGYRRDVTNLDFIVFNHEQASFGTPEAQIRKAREELNRLPQVRIPNYAYRNKGDLQMEDVSAQWGLDQVGYSNGAIYADLDNDGDLDLVTNNIDDEAFLLENRLNQQKNHPHWLRLQFGSGPEVPLMQGTKVWLYAGGQVQMQELSPVRGYVSTVENALHFGTGTASRFDSLVIRYPDGQRQRVVNGPVDRLLKVPYQPTGRWVPEAEPKPLFTELSPVQSGLGMVHQGSDFVDFNRTPLLPHQYSRNGPALATGDANGDGLDDVFLGGGAGKPAQLCLQERNGTFRPVVFSDAGWADDLDALFFDADRDGDQDLYVVSGGSREEGTSAIYQDRLYLNAGNAQFTVQPGRLPRIQSSGSCVEAADFDQDGDLDLFRGGRVVPGQYPKPADSYLLRNDNGTFHDVTEQLAPQLRHVGMVTAALWTDTDNDRRLDLLIVGEWMSPTLFKNSGTHLRLSPLTGLGEGGSGDAPGWWNSLAGHDFDQDGDQDYVLGNLGLNSKFRASRAEPVQVYADDFDHNGTYDPVLTFFLNHQHVPVPQRDVLMAQIPSIKKRFPTYQDYAKRVFEETFTEEEREKAFTREATQLASCYLENQGNNRFVLRPLPIEAQFAPANALLAGDFTGDGRADLLLAGNSYASETIGGWYDAGKGLLLMSDGKGRFRAAPQAGLDLDRDVKAMTPLTRPDGSAWVLVANHNGPLQVVRPRITKPLTPPSDRVATGSGTRPAGTRTLSGKRG